jgi:hypothetical protein
VLEPGDEDVTVNATLDDPLGLDSLYGECHEQCQVAATKNVAPRLGVVQDGALRAKSG